MKRFLSFLTLAALLSIMGCSVDVVLREEVSGQITEDGFSATGMYVQSLMESVPLEGSNFTIAVPEGELQQFIAVTDASTNIHLLYRGTPKPGQIVEIDAHSTAVALVSLHPLIGPIVRNQYGQIADTISAQSHFADLEAAIADAVAAHRPISDTTNRPLMDALYAVVAELCDTAGLQQAASGITGDVSDYINCHPLVVSVSGHTVTMRTQGLCPSYYGSVQDDEGQQVADIKVLARADYGGMNLFTRTAGSAHLGNPASCTLTHSGSHSFHLSCTGTEGCQDLSLHLAGNVLDMLGMDMDNDMVEHLSDGISAALSDMEGAAPDPMDIVGAVYGAMTTSMTNEARNMNRWPNWQLASTLLQKSQAVYTAVKEASADIMRLCYAPSMPEDIDFCLSNHTQNGISPCSEITIAIADGNSQTAEEHTALPVPLQVVVSTLTESGLYRYPQHTVRFTVVEGGGEVSSATVQTSSDGMAQTSWTLGAAGSQAVTAVVIDPLTEEELSNTVTFTATATAPPPSGSGFFSVSAGHQVRFALGNLEYDGSYHFAAHQYDYGGYFGWGTGSNPTLTATDWHNYPSFDDWGDHIDGGWRTLSADEWYYVIWGRANASAKRGTAIVCGVPGIVLLPDSWNGGTFRAAFSGWGTNVYNASSWSHMEDAGAVFLPAAGLRYGTEMINVGTNGGYWSSTPVSENYAYNMNFNDNNAYNYGGPRDFGLTVRLVLDY